MKGPRFLFHAHATGVSGRITRPFDEALDVQAASALPPSGGYSSARQHSIRIREILSIDVARTETSGSLHESKQANVTSATAIVEGFDLCGVVVASGITG